MKTIKVEINLKVPDDYDARETEELVYYLISDCAWDDMHDLGYKPIDFFIIEYEEKNSFLFFEDEEEE